MKRIGLRIALLLPLLGLALTAPAGAQAATAAGTARPTLHQVQLRILEQTNAYRRHAGLRPLRLDPVMSRVATWWSGRQAAVGDMSHNPAYARQIPTGWRRCGENVAYGYSVGRVTRAWFHSAPHRRNLLGRYTRIGIGYALDRHGVAYYTQDFARY